MLGPYPCLSCLHFSGTSEASLSLSLSLSLDSCRKLMCSFVSIPRAFHWVSSNSHSMSLSLTPCLCPSHSLFLPLSLSFSLSLSQLGHVITESRPAGSSEVKLNAFTSTEKIIIKEMPQEPEWASPSAESQLCTEIIMLR